MQRGQQEPCSPWLAWGGSSTVEALVALPCRSRGSRSPSCPCTHPAALAPPVPQLWPRWLPWGPCPTQGPSCSSREWGLSLSSRLGPKAQEFVIKTEKTIRETRILLPPGLGGEMATRALSQMSRVSPASTRTCQSPALLLSACSPAPRSWMPKEKESSPAAPIHLGWHFRASQSRLQVGVHHGLTVWRLNVVGGFLELEQHGHLWGQEACR